MIRTRYGTDVESVLVGNYFKTLVNLFFKILPLWENKEDSLPIYVESLQLELLGFKSLIPAINSDAAFLSLVSILQYMIDHPESETAIVKREVFRAISICNKLKDRYNSAEVSLR